jgi:putative flippase GtrA
MIQRLLGVSIGALVTFLVLWLSTVAKPVDPMPWYVAAAIIGAITSFFWPVVIGFWLRGRARDRRDDAVEREVQRQLADERSKEDDQQ